MPISFGWAAGDVSLAAYIQACLARREDESAHVSALGAVMAFLYTKYIVLYAIMQPLLGKYVDEYVEHGGRPQSALKNIASVQFTVISAVLLASTFIPKGALSLNPKLLFDEDLSGEVSLTGAGKESSSDDDVKGPITSEHHDISHGPIAVDEEGLPVPAHGGAKRPSFDEKEDLALGMAEAAHG